MIDNIIKNIENASGGKVQIELTFIWERKTEQDILEYRYRFTDLDLKEFDLDSLTSLFGVKLAEALKHYKGGLNESTNSILP